VQRSSPGDRQPEDNRICGPWVRVRPVVPVNPSTSTTCPFDQHLLCHHRPVPRALHQQQWPTLCHLPGERSARGWAAHAVYTALGVPRTTRSRCTTATMLVGDTGIAAHVRRAINGNANADTARSTFKTPRAYRSASGKASSLTGHEHGPAVEATPGRGCARARKRPRDPFNPASSVRSVASVGSRQATTGRRPCDRTDETGRARHVHARGSGRTRPGDPGPPPRSTSLDGGSSPPRARCSWRPGTDLVPRRCSLGRAPSAGEGFHHGAVREDVAHARTSPPPCGRPDGSVVSR
jgi:hypothetical protein